MKTMNLQEANPVSSPGEEARSGLEEVGEEKLDPRMASEYRALAARANFLALDRPDVQFAVKEICRGMGNPTRDDKKKVKRLARYILGRPRLVSRFDFQQEGKVIDGYSDSDWAGCRRTARSTSGGVILVGSHCVKSWSSMQRRVTLSSGEAELTAAIKMASEVTGMLQMMKEWGMDREGKIYVDSSAAIGITQRKGNGKLRHVRVGLLWIQERVEDGDVSIRKVLGTENPGDAMTKHLPGPKIDTLMEKTSQEPREGRSEISLQI